MASLTLPRRLFLRHIHAPSPHSISSPTHHILFIIAPHLDQSLLHFLHPLLPPAVVCRSWIHAADAAVSEMRQALSVECLQQRPTLQLVNDESEMCDGGGQSDVELGILYTDPAHDAVCPDVQVSQSRWQVQSHSAKWPHVPFVSDDCQLSQRLTASRVAEDAAELKGEQSASLIVGYDQQHQTGAARDKMQPTVERGCRGLQKEQPSADQVP